MTLEDLANNAGRRFLQSVLVVDDQGVFPPPVPDDGGVEEKPHKVPGPGPPDDALPAQTTVTAPPDHAPMSTPPESIPLGIDLKALSDRFADLGIACGILNPRGEAEAAKRIMTAGSCADILILDWQLSNDNGETVSSAVCDLAQTPFHGRRLIAIYTTQRPLGDISTQLQDKAGAIPVGGDELVLEIGGTRIHILHKGGVELGEEERARVVLDDLPSYVVDAFCKMEQGLVPSIALNAIAATRENTQRLLARLSKELDIGYAGQMMRVEHSTDAQEHLLGAIADEFRAIINDDERARKAAGLEGLSAWLAHREDAGLLQASSDSLVKFAEAKGGDPQQQAAFLKENPQIADLSEKSYGELLTSVESAADARRSDAEFSMLMSLRRSYEHPIRMLQLGTIVRMLDAPARYWLCVQPLCDSVRLSDPTVFPLLRLEEVAPDGPKRKFHVVVQDETTGDYVQLWLGDKPSDLHLLQVSPNHRGVAAFTMDAEGASARLATRGSGEIEWKGQLKPDHAQRIAVQLADNLSRVGLDESEWLRLRGREGKTPPDTRFTPAATQTLGSE